MIKGCLSPEGLEFPERGQPFLLMVYIMEGNMKNLGSHNWLSLFIFLIAGGILGGIVGEALYAVPALQGVLPALTQHYEILNIQQIHLNLYLMELQFGIHLAPNLLSVIGILLAGVLFRHIQ